MDTVKLPWLVRVMDASRLMRRNGFRHLLSSSKVWDAYKETESQLLEQARLREEELNTEGFGGWRLDGAHATAAPEPQELP